MTNHLPDMDPALLAAMDQIKMLHKDIVREAAEHRKICESAHSDICPGADAMAMILASGPGAAFMLLILSLSQEVDRAVGT
jgi:hypothetical protein